jgi:predicted RNase H-like nuclease (RuvC/YqgF family)
MAAEIDSDPRILSNTFLVVTPEVVNACLNTSIPWIWTYETNFVPPALGTEQYGAEIEQQEEEYYANVGALEKALERLKVVMAELHERKEKVLDAEIGRLKEERERYQSIIDEKFRFLKKLEWRMYELEMAPNSTAR